MAQNLKGEEPKKSEHGNTSAFVSSTTLLSLSEADGAGASGQTPSESPAPLRELVSSCNGVTDTRSSAACRLCRWRVTGRGLSPLYHVG